ncbi:MAG: hypothetical protein BWY49_00728 [Candidatus Omnitrophica bacterium ADurb.Bin314]|nr:MAG: hypothetical protein BWY49_00728 [Candidatus Omnitrophica bacterium ADurb.Bin314]
MDIENLGIKKQVPETFDIGAVLLTQPDADIELPPSLAKLGGHHALDRGLRRQGDIKGRDTVKRRAFFIDIQLGLGGFFADVILDMDDPRNTRQL